MKKSPPKNLFVRYIENGKKFSIGEYIRAKWNNAVDPFKIDDIETFKAVREMVALYEKRTGRTIEFVSYGNPEALTKFKELYDNTAN